MKVLEKLALNSKNQLLLNVMYILNLHHRALAYNHNMPTNRLLQMHFKYKNSWFIQSGLENNKNFINLNI